MRLFLVDFIHACRGGRNLARDAADTTSPAPWLRSVLQGGCVNLRAGCALCSVGFCPSQFRTDISADSLISSNKQIRRLCGTGLPGLVLDTQACRMMGRHVLTNMAVSFAELTASDLADLIGSDTSVLQNQICFASPEHYRRSHPLPSLEYQNMLFEIPGDARLCSPGRPSACHLPLICICAICIYI